MRHNEVNAIVVSHSCQKRPKAFKTNHNAPRRPVRRLRPNQNRPPRTRNAIQNAPKRSKTLHARLIRKLRPDQTRSPRPQNGVQKKTLHTAGIMGDLKFSSKTLRVLVFFACARCSAMSGGMTAVVDLRIENAFKPDENVVFLTASDNTAFLVFFTCTRCSVMSRGMKAVVDLRIESALEAEENVVFLKMVQNHLVPPRRRLAIGSYSESFRSQGLASQGFQAVVPVVPVVLVACCFCCQNAQKATTKTASKQHNWNNWNYGLEPLRIETLSKAFYCEPIASFWDALSMRF